MSIETERWVYDDKDGVLRFADTRESVPLYEYRREAQVLPEALALLKDLLKNYEAGEAIDRQCSDILRRAGVLR